MVAPRPAKPTVQFIDEYCQWYQPLFSEVSTPGKAGGLMNVTDSKAGVLARGDLLIR